MERGLIKTVLEQHFLLELICNHHLCQDKPVCACSSLDLGWHASVGQAVAAWAEHVTTVLEAAEQISAG